MQRRNSHLGRGQFITKTKRKQFTSCRMVIDHENDVPPNPNHLIQEGKKKEKKRNRRKRKVLLLEMIRSIRSNQTIEFHIVFT